MRTIENDSQYNGNRQTEQTNKNSSDNVNSMSDSLGLTPSIVEFRAFEL